MKTIFDACKPRGDVLSGELRDEMFAAKLEDVARGTADPIYQDPARFFANTHPARGLRSLLEEALGRLSGKRPSASPIIRLETSFGGGKTHSLIALYHLARGAVPAEAEAYLDPELLPEAPIRTAALVGSALDPAQGIEHEVATTYTIWGELAYQLGAYEAVAESDRARTAPGTHTLEKVLGDGPVLVLIDELARYLEVGKAHKIGESTLAEQTKAFFMALLEATDSKERVCVVYTLATSADAFAAQTDEIHRILAEARSISARKEHVISPTQEDEIAAIVRHRLFEDADPQAARECARAYHEAYVTELDRGADLPMNAREPGYAADIKNDYPFHPELLRALDNKVGTIPNFQRTRGALRLLARTVRRLWQTRQPQTYLIHTHHVDLSDEDILNDLTSRLDRPVFRQVAEADIVNPKAGAKGHAALLDDEMISAGRPPYATRLATTVFLHSLVQGQGAGLTPTEAQLAVYTPGDDTGLISKQLERLLDNCWFLDTTGTRLRFSTEPSLVKIVHDETQLVHRTSAKKELDTKIRTIWKKGALDPVFFPAEPQDIEEAYERPKLAVVHYDAARASAELEGPPDLVVHLADRAGAAQNYRRYRNNVIFLVADEDSVDHAVETARRYLALGRIKTDAGRYSEFTKEQQSRIGQMAKEAELELRVAITRMYRHLYYPDPSALEKHARLAHARLEAQEQGEVERDQSEVVLRTLKSLDRVITAESPDIPPKLIRDKAWPANNERLSTLALRQQFAMSVGLKILLDVNKLKKAIKLGVRNGYWLYYDPRRGCAWSKDSTTTPPVEISDDMELVLPETAQGIPICDLPASELAEEPTCPVCHNPIDRCTCGTSTPSDLLQKSFVAKGAPGQAFQAIVDQASDRQAKRLRSLSAEIDAEKADLLGAFRTMALAVPQLPKAKVDVVMQATLDLRDATSLKVQFRGPWDRYRALHDAIQKTKPDDVSDATGHLKLVLSFPQGIDPHGPELETIRDVFVQLNPGAMTIEADPESEER